MGLLLSHKSKISIATDMIVISHEGGGNCNGGGKRGKINTFSREARKRMIEMLHSVVFERMAMITLTYGGDFPENPKVWKKNLKEFRRRFEDKWGKVRGVWRLEFQKRGAPHFHILYLDMPFVPIAEVQDVWYSVIHTPIPMRVGNAVDLEVMPVRSNKRLVMAYVSKYIAKISDDDDTELPEGTGRIWGYWNVEDVQVETCVLYDGEAREVAELVMSMWAKNYYTPDDFTQCTLFGEELGTGEFQETVKRVVKEVVRKRRYKLDNSIEFVTCNRKK